MLHMNIDLVLHVHICRWTKISRIRLCRPGWHFNIFSSNGRLQSCKHVHTLHLLTFCFMISEHICSRVNISRLPCPWPILSLWKYLHLYILLCQIEWIINNYLFIHYMVTFQEVSPNSLMLFHESSASLSLSDVHIVYLKKEKWLDFLFQSDCHWSTLECHEVSWFQ
jgi:hypothetical protein